MAMYGVGPAPRWRRVVAVVAVALLLGACSMFGRPTGGAADVPAGTAEELFAAGTAAEEGGRFGEAALYFAAVDLQHPYSARAREALFLAARSYYRVGLFEDAISYARRYITLFPAGPDVPEALYVIGDSYYLQIPNVERDQEATTRAIVAFDELINRYPSSPFVEQAQIKRRFAVDQIAGREMTVGRFYLQRREYLAAIGRFRVVVTDYQVSSHIEEALFRLVEAHLALGLVMEAQSAAAVLAFNYPASEWYRDAYALLQRQDLLPRLGEGSWIGRLFRVG